MTYLLDTNVVSELVSQRPNQQVLNWLAGLDPDSVYLSVITIGELRKGAERLPESRRRRDLMTWINHEVLRQFENRVLSLDFRVALTWGELIGRLDAVGKRMPGLDSLIAATALHYGMTLVTRNEVDFANAGILIHNPWK